MTVVLFFSILISCVGNPFLYGYQIGVINQPAELVKIFYNQTYYERAGGDWHHIMKYEAYLQANMSDTEFITTHNISVNSTTMEALTNVKNENVTKLLRPEQFGAQPEFLLADWELKILWSCTVAAFVLFGMIGAFMSAGVSDYFGRKRGMILITFIMFMAAVSGGIALMVASPECLIVSRVLVGFHSGLCITLCPLYLTEISPKRIRGAVGTCFQLFITIGILVSQLLGLKEVLGTADLWPFLFWFNAVPSLICLIFLPFCPESPRFLLIKKGEEGEARRALIRFRGTSRVAEEIEEMRQEASKSRGVNNYTLKELLTSPELKMPVIIACVLQISQQWSGINAVFSYSTMMFKLVNIPGEQIQYVVVGTGAINVLCTIIAVPLMEKLGRRPLLLYPTICMLISFIIMTVALNLQTMPEYEEQKGTLAMICIVTMHTFIIGFALGIGPIPFIVVGEIFRQEPRAAAMSLSLAFNWVCNFSLLLTFPFLKDALQEFVYVLFMVIISIAIVFIFFFVPETKNKTFNEVANSIALGGRAKGRRDRYDTEEMKPMRS